MDTVTFSVVLAAAGKSSRFRAAETKLPAAHETSPKKVFADLAGYPVWYHAAQRFHACECVQQLMVVLAEEDLCWFEEQYGEWIEEFSLTLIAGGAERADSVKNALESASAEYIAIHDAARACITPEEIVAVFEAAQETKASILATPCHATLKRCSGTQITETVPRTDLWLAQTPQVFRTDLLREAYEQHPDPSSATDDASLVQALGHPVQVVEGQPTNLKITTKQDLELARAILAIR